MSGRIPVAETLDLSLGAGHDPGQRGLSVAFALHVHECLVEIRLPSATKRRHRWIDAHLAELHLDTVDHLDDLVIQAQRAKSFVNAAGLPRLALDEGVASVVDEFSEKRTGERDDRLRLPLGLIGIEERRERRGRGTASH